MVPWEPEQLPARREMDFRSYPCYPQGMQITVQLPDDLVQRPDPAREALESLAIEGYRSGALSGDQASRLLGLSRFEFEGFLKERSVFDHAYSAQDLEDDCRALDELRSQGNFRE